VNRSGNGCGKTAVAITAAAILYRREHTC
jgi:hypothetical protein